MRTLQQLAEDEGQNYPEASRVTLNDFYVDDLLTGAQTIAETKELIDQLKDLMKKGGFHLRKWNSNCHEIVSHVEEMNEEKKIKLEKGAISKILGIVWDHVQDTFRVNITLPEEVVTKRDLLSNIARIFDPIGFLSPTTVALKIIMQELWRGGTGWDEHIPNDIKEKWNNFRAELLKLEDLSIPRYVWACEKDRDVQLHGFCDASSVSYSAVCYLRTVSLDGQVHISMLAAKTRVAPCKSLTLPRLELCAALLLSQLYRSVVDSLKIDIGRTYLWSDSQISMSWIKSDPNRWKTFIQNRVVKIQQLSYRNSWRHVSGKDNPADCASRGIMPAALSGHTLWWQGPTWLKDNNFVQNQDNCYGRECHEEEKVALACQSRVSVCPEIVTKYSTFIKTRRIIAWCLRFITNCRVSLKKREIGTLSKKELENAVIRIIGWIQEDEFGEEMQDLRNTGHASRKSRILQLNPFIDASGMLRVGGRIQFANDFNKSCCAEAGGQATLEECSAQVDAGMPDRAKAQALEDLLRQKCSSLASVSDHMELWKKFFSQCEEGSAMEKEMKECTGDIEVKADDMKCFEEMMSTGSRGRSRVESLGMSIHKALALSKFREQIKVELGAKDGEIEDFLLVYMMDEMDLWYNRRWLTQMVK
ncbi:hypothetical protein LAZ67_3001266 [Cordylochernes scorpioides]|uniref:Uncharacterized protein n=1 Tax=Cordylochernes scorpioides TaxID=51811 RepID=A0ABY6K7N5_9ARAC|nr:hypothetical protein LAZ67_3001266 [Cordylochernes scorpioides]